MGVYLIKGPDGAWWFGWCVQTENLNLTNAWIHTPQGPHKTRQLAFDRALHEVLPRIMRHRETFPPAVARWLKDVGDNELLVPWGPRCLAA